MSTIQKLGTGRAIILIWARSIPHMQGLAPPPCSGCGSPASFALEDYQATEHFSELVPQGAVGWKPTDDATWQRTRDEQLSGLPKLRLMLCMCRAHTTQFLDFCLSGGYHPGAVEDVIEALEDAYGGALCGHSLVFYHRVDTPDIPELAVVRKGVEVGELAGLLAHPNIAIDISTNTLQTSEAALREAYEAWQAEKKEARA